MHSDTPSVIRGELIKLFCIIAVEGGALDPGTSLCLPSCLMLPPRNAPLPPLLLRRPGGPRLDCPLILRLPGSGPGTQWVFSPYLLTEASVHQMIQKHDQTLGSGDQWATSGAESSWFETYQPGPAPSPWLSFTYSFRAVLSFFHSSYWE